MTFIAGVLNFLLKFYYIVEGATMDEYVKDLNTISGVLLKRMKLDMVMINGIRGTNVLTITQHVGERELLTKYINVIKDAVNKIVI